ncbi:hypothetical protein [Pseudoalteromonas maricaloris]|uniref:Uncharacterized protein n=1 Tax=Pseudoalteromonas maricaloris TaxID=184924 RepID=A0A8I2H9G4_9GAMM|nr:hypothetical protein [Pseudoalteromonas maricaloris]NLR23439.1 hypothetical protein [Pseudoalteromonas maricaloris]WOX29184.1 hypothetical protein R5H13_02620 [Pseudoalteromonas maricaloris]
MVLANMNAKVGGIYPKIVMLTMSLTIIFCAIDFSDKAFWASSEISPNEVDISALARVQWGISNQTISKYKESFDGYRYEEVESSEPVEKQFTKEDEYTQSGSLTEVFVDNNVLKLKAVISKGESFQVIIEVENKQTGELSISQVTNNSDLFSFKVRVINTLSIELTRTIESREQKIQLTMFQLPTASQKVQ